MGDTMKKSLALVLMVCVAARLGGAARKVRSARRSRAHGRRSSGHGDRHRRERHGHAGARLRRAQTRQPREGRWRHHLHDRLDRQGDDDRGARDARRCRQTQVGRSRRGSHSRLPDVRPVGHARDDGARSARASQRAGSRRGRPAGHPARHACRAPKSSGACDSSSPRPASAADTRTTTFFTSSPVT